MKLRVYLMMMIGPLVSLHQAVAQVGFTLASSPVVGANPHSVAAADINGAGKVDLICANYVGNSLTVLTNNGSGTFGSNATYTVGSEPISVVAADLVIGLGNLVSISTCAGRIGLTR